ncbi:MAG: hypothetical protein MH321_13675 [Leptospiraceae bacterium]|nr:hypothetical protein [Leptospiraceae bacterium]
MDKLQYKNKIADEEQSFNFLSFLKMGNWTFPSLYSRNYFSWKLKQNPFEVSFGALRYVDNSDVAHTSIVSKPLNPRINLGITCGELGDSHTHPDFQKQGHFGEIGSFVINQYSDKFNGKAFIYGIPNDNAVRGWQTRCKCELLTEVGIYEYSLSWKFSFPSFKNIKLRIIENKSEILSLVNKLWQNSYKNKISLIEKSEKWVIWRYLNSTESYSILSLEDDQFRDSSAYMIAKISKKFFFTNIDICDVIGTKVDDELLIIKKMLSKYKSFFVRIRIWAYTETLVEKLLLKSKFKKVKKVNIIVFKNDSLINFKNNKIDLHISLGDTDNC